MNRAKEAILILVFSLLFGCIGMVGLAWRASQGSPIQISLPPSFSPATVVNSNFALRFRFTRHEDCVTLFTRDAVRLGRGINGEIVRVTFNLSASPLTPVRADPSEQDWTYLVPIPITMPAGEWWIRIERVDVCNLFNIISPTIRAIPDFPVVVPELGTANRYPWLFGRTKPSEIASDGGIE